VGPRTLPGHAPFNIAADFESPTDLAWSGVPYEDFDVADPKALAAPWLYAVVPPSGKFLTIGAP